MAIYVAAPVSGAHLNPAVTISFTIWRKFPIKKLIYYVIAQILGAFLAGICIFGIFHRFLSDFESKNAIIRGTVGSERSAMIFGEYFPNPAFYYSSPNQGYDLLSPIGACAMEGFGTLILVFVIYAFTDKNSSHHKNKTLIAMSPFFIGSTVSIVMSILAPLTQAGLNPARDFGPRLVASFVGFRSIAFPGPRNSFWAYIVGPIVGSVIAGLIYKFTIGKANEIERKKEL